jgi:hypothetical protein
MSLCDLKGGTRQVIGRQAETLSDEDRGTHPAGPTQRISDCVSGGRFRDSAVFSDYYRRP